MKTIAVVELDYRFKLEVAGGRHTTLFNQATRLTRDQGGNEYDAASKFMAMITIMGGEETDAQIDAMMRASMRSAQLRSKTACPEQCAVDWEVAKEAWDQA